MDSLYKPGKVIAFQYWRKQVKRNSTSVQKIATKYWHDVIFQTKYTKNRVRNAS